MNDDLGRRLRVLADSNNAANIGLLWSACDEAADEIERLKWELEDTAGQLRLRNADAAHLLAQSTDTDVENRRLRAALQWYADNLGASRSKDMRIITQDGGNRARAALCAEPSARETMLPPIPPSASGVTGIVCVHCQGKGVEPQHYDERTGWSDEHVPCATCQGTGRIYTVEQYLKTLPADWHQDSSLAAWFPLLPEEIKRLESERDALKAENERLTRLTTVNPVLVGLIERCASECAECEGTGRHLKEQPSPDEGVLPVRMRNAA